MPTSYIMKWFSLPRSGEGDPSRSPPLVFYLYSKPGNQPCTYYLQDPSPFRWIPALLPLPFSSSSTITYGGPAWSQLFLSFPVSSPVHPSICYRWAYPISARAHTGEESDGSDRSDGGCNLAPLNNCCSGHRVIVPAPLSSPTATSVPVLAIGPILRLGPSAAGASSADCVAGRTALVG